MGTDSTRDAGIPSTDVPDEELPSSVRRMGQMGWVREPLDGTVHGKRIVISPPAAATIGTPADGEKDALLARVRDERGVRGHHRPEFSAAQGRPGFDGSPVAHMWRTMIWPNNFV
jgi:hypothetical protein